VSKRPSATNNDPGYFYNPKRLMQIFTGVTAALMASILWMIWADFERPWKADQRAELRWESGKLGVEAMLLEARTQADRAKLDALLEAAQERFDAQKAELDKIEADLRLAESGRYAAELDYKGQKQYTTEADYFVHEASTPEERDAWLHKLEVSRDREHRLRDALQLATANRDALLDSKKSKLQELDALRDQERKNPELARLKLTVEARKRKASFHPARNLPLLDFLAPPTKVEQVVLDNIVDNYEFATPKKVDRCGTCHIGIARTGFEPEKWPLEILDLPAGDPEKVEKFEQAVYRFVFGLLEAIWPKVPPDSRFPHEDGLLRTVAIHHATLDTLFADYDDSDGTIGVDEKTSLKVWRRYERLDDATWKESPKGRSVGDYYLAALQGMASHWRAHPHMDSMVGTNSPHPYETFGCTVCHLGRGWSTDFGRAWHSPPLLTVDDWMTTERAHAEHRHLPANAQMSLEEAMQAGHSGEGNVHQGFVSDKATEARWKGLGRTKTELQYWNYPQLPLSLVQASCLKCHKDGVYASPREEYLHAHLGAPHAGLPDTLDYEDHAREFNNDPDLDTSRRIFIPEEKEPYRPAQLERGQDNFLRFGCYGCHKLDAAIYPLMETQRPKVGPPLDPITAKTDEAFLLQWVYNPKAFRPDTRMPRFWELSNNSHTFSYRFAEGGYLTEQVDGKAWGESEAYAIVQYLLAQSKGGAGGAEALGDPKKGERLIVGDYAASGGQAKACIACHDVPIASPELKVDPDKLRAWTDPRTQRVYGWGDRMSRQHGPNLAGIGSKVKASWLVSWLKDPRGYWHDTNMPDLRLTDEEARDVAAYLMTLKNPEFEALKTSDPVTGDQGILRRIAEELKVSEQQESTKDAIRIVAGMSEQDRTQYVGRKLIAHYGCFGCHQMESFKDATPIGTELTKWGSKSIERLEFNHAPIEHGRFEFAYAKMVNPRVYDLGMPRADLPFDRLKMPRFDFTPEEARDLAVFLLGLVDDPVDAASFRPDAHQRVLIEGRKVVHRYNCQACHIIEGKGADVWPAVAEAKWRPPDLLGQGLKTRPAWLFEFFKKPYEIRPWHSIRMPTFHFTDEEDRALVAYFAALSRVPYPFEEKTADGLMQEGKEIALPAAVRLKVGDPNDRAKKVDRSVTTRRDMANAMFTEYQCKSCHSTDPAVPIGNRAPDFRHTREGRLRAEWIEKWLWNPGKLQAGTAMPSFFAKGQAQDPQFFGASAEEQLRALRDYILNHYAEKDR